MNRSGIYEIVNSVNGKRYVGSALNLRTRWNDHSHRLINNIHYNAPMQRAWNKYDESAFWFSVIELCDKAELVEREQAAINALKPEYNILTIARSPLGRRHSQESKRKMSLAKTGRQLSAEHRSRISAGNTGKTMSESARQNMSISQTGRLVSAEHRAKIGSANRGKKHSVSARQKMSAAKIGNKYSLGYRRSAQSIAKGIATLKRNKGNRNG